MICRPVNILIMSRKIYFYLSIDALLIFCKTKFWKEAKLSPFRSHNRLVTGYELSRRMNSLKSRIYFSLSTEFNLVLVRYHSFLS